MRTPRTPDEEISAAVLVMFALMLMGLIFLAVCPKSLAGG